MVVECPGCHSRYDVGARPTGMEIRCRCGTGFPVPALDASAGSLDCPNCGAGISPADPSCPYCRTVLALAACPRCFGRVFRGNSFCQHCGAPIGTGGAAGHATPEGASQRLCPRCLPEVESRLTAHLIGDTLLDECQNCGGLWIDRAAFDRVVEDRSRQSKLLAVNLDGSRAAAGSPDSATPGAAVPPVRYLPCPDCRVLMNRKNFGERSGVIVEVCKPHGIWFDRDQLSVALRFVMAGGLEETHRRHLEEIARQRSAARPVSARNPAYDLALHAKGIGVIQVGQMFVDALRHFFQRAV
jgi:Zn-finger nucleic acid-binding protein